MPQPHVNSKGQPYREHLNYDSALYVEVAGDTERGNLWIGSDAPGLGNYVGSISIARLLRLLRRTGVIGAKGN